MRWTWALIAVLVVALGWFAWQLNSAEAEADCWQAYAHRKDPIQPPGMICYRRSKDVTI